MGTFKKEYALYRRPTKRGPAIYYCRFCGEDDRYLTAVAIAYTDRRKAEAWANRQLRIGAVVTRRSLTFESFAEACVDQRQPLR
jgi:hypothetical protein